MKPGRELDLLIANKVMGWKCTMIHSQYGDREPECHHCPRYSTGIAEAWLVVEKVSGCEFSLSYSDGLMAPYWRAEFFIDSGDGGWACAGGESAPHAICLAALEALKELASEPIQSA